MAAPGPQAAAGRAPAADQPEHDPQRRAGRPLRSGQDDAGRGPARRDRDDPRAGRVEDGTTVSDFDEAEVRQQRSVSLALAPFEHDGIKVNLLDTPGYADFVGDLRAGLRAADAALFVVSAADGIDGATRLLWEECAAVGMPRAVVDHQARPGRAPTSTRRVAVCQRVFGDGVLPLYLPMPTTTGPSAA